MARIFITGSSDGLGSLVAQRLISRGHTVVLHARNAQRAKDASTACPGAEAVLTGDLSSLTETKRLAEQANALTDGGGGKQPFDCVIHNAGIYRGSYAPTGEQDLPALVAVNSVAPYVLTCLMHTPKRLIFLSSGLHYGGDASLEDAFWRERGAAQWNEGAAYGTSKLHNVIFAKAFARRWPEVRSNSLDPGWVPTKMGGKGATGSLEKAVETYVLLAEGAEEGAKVSGCYFEPGRVKGEPKKEAADEVLQDRLMEMCAELTGVRMP